MKYKIQSCTIYFVGGRHEKLPIKEELIVNSVKEYKHSILNFMEGIEHVRLTYTEIE